MRTKRTETTSVGRLSPNGEKEWANHELREELIFEDGVLRHRKISSDGIFGPAEYIYDEKGRQIYAYVSREIDRGGIERTTVYDDESGIATDTTSDVLWGFRSDKKVETREINNDEEPTLIYNEKKQLLEKIDEYHHYYTYDDAGRCIKIIVNGYDRVQNDDNNLDGIEDADDYDSNDSGSLEEIPFKEITREYDSSGNLLSMEILVYCEESACLRDRSQYFGEKLVVDEDDIVCEWSDDEDIDYVNYREDRFYKVRIARKFDWKTLSIEPQTPNFALNLENDWSEPESSACIFESIEAELLSADGTPTGEIELKTEMTVDKNCPEEFGCSIRNLLTDEIIRVHSNTVECDNGKKEHKVINRINSAGEIVEKLFECDNEYNAEGRLVRKEELDYHNLRWETKECEEVDNYEEKD